MIRVPDSPSASEAPQLTTEAKPVSAVVATTPVRSGDSTRERFRRAGVSQEAESDGGESDSVRVDLSGAGKAMSVGDGRGKGSRHADLEDAPLPDEIKKILRRIRHIREDMRQKQSELRHALADRRLSPDKREVMAALLQAKIMSLTAELHTATGALEALVRDLGLDSGVVAQLLTA